MLDGRKGFTVGALVVLAFAVVAVGYFFLRDADSAQVNFVCVATGEGFDIDRSKLDAIPAVNPKTGRRTLMPCYEKDGRRYVDSHYRQIVKELGGVNRYVDTETLAVRVPP